jgi:hypothetical protein
MPVSSDWQAEYAGLLLGDGTVYEIREIQGLADQPDLRTSDRARLRRHGLLPGDDFLAARAVTVDLEVFGADDAAFAAAMAALKLALAPGNPEAPLTFKVPGVAGGGIRRLNARPRKLALPVDLDRFFYRQPTATVLFEASDPRLYDDALSSVSTGLAVSPSGLVWNLTWNLSWGASSSSGSIFAVNAGTFPTPPVFRIDGPVTNPSVENITTGEKLALSADGGLVVGAGEFVELDTDARTVLLGGTASRYSKLSADSTWFDLKPGTTELKFRGTTAGAPTLTVTWRSAWT